MVALATLISRNLDTVKRRTVRLQRINPFLRRRLNRLPVIRSQLRTGNILIAHVTMISIQEA